MAAVRTNSLDAAYEDGFFDEPLSKKAALYLRPGVVTAWRIINAIVTGGEEGLNIEQICDRVVLDPNTVKIYCRWLREKGLIEWETFGPGGVLIYYPPTEAN